MSDYEGYPEYKDSRAKWLGDIPASWDVVDPKHAFTLRSENPAPGDIHLMASQQYGVIPQKEYLESTGKRLVEVFSDMARFKHIGYNDFLIHLRSFQGGIEHCINDGKVTAAYTVISPNLAVILPLYAKYLLKSKYYISGIASTTNQLRDGQSIKWKDFRKVMLPLPPLETQQRIVEFLDSETAHIDAGIANMESLIALLTEKRSALISEVVTRGIPGEHTEFKDSGVEWLGEIPVTRTTVVTGRVLATKKEVVGENHSEYDLLSLTKKGVIFRDKNSGVGKFPESFDTYQLVQPEELVFCLFDTEETPRTVGLVHQEGMITGAYTRFQVNKKMANPDFLENYFISIDNKKGFKPLYTGLRKTIQKPRFLSSKMPLPPLEEQERIVAFIQQNTRDIDGLLNIARSSISLLKEKRQVLISDVVTGKIDVTNSTN